MQKGIDAAQFTASDLINFLSDMHTTQSYAVSTLQLFRSAITHLHRDPQALQIHDALNGFSPLSLKTLNPLVFTDRPSVFNLASISSLARLQLLLIYNGNSPFFLVSPAFYALPIYIEYHFLR